MSKVLVDREVVEQSVSKDRIREIFMAAGFTIKDGQTDLKQYVYDAAYALLNEVPQPAQQPVATVSEVHMSRYTIEWTNGPLPEGTSLYAAPQDDTAPQPAQQPLPEIDYRAAIRAAYATDRKWAQGTAGCIAFKCGAEWYRWTLTHPEQPAPRYEPTDEGIGND